MDMDAAGKFDLKNDGKTKIEVTPKENENHNARTFEKQKLNDATIIENIDAAWLASFLFLYRIVASILLFLALFKNDTATTSLLMVSKVLCICSLIADFLRCVIKNEEFNDRRKIDNFFIKILFTNAFVIFLVFMTWIIYNYDAKKLICIYPFCVLGSWLVESLLRTLFDPLFDLYIFPTGFLLFFISVLMLCDLEDRQILCFFYCLIFGLYIGIYGGMKKVKKMNVFHPRAKRNELLVGIALIVFFICCCLYGIKYRLFQSENFKDFILKIGIDAQCRVE